jgi:hypothetical protein
MVFLDLLVKSDMENVSELKAGSEQFQWFCTVICGNCNEERPDVGISVDEKVEMQGSRGEANLCIKCKLCNREASIDVDPKGFGSYNGGDFTRIARFECRGCTLDKWQPRDGFSCIGVNEEGEPTGTKFEDINLEDEWCVVQKLCVSAPQRVHTVSSGAFFCSAAPKRFGARKTRCSPCYVCAHLCFFYLAGVIMTKRATPRLRSQTLRASLSAVRRVPPEFPSTFDQT